MTINRRTLLKMAALIGLAPLATPKAAAHPDKRGRLYVMVGLAKTGKTTLANEIKRRSPSMIVIDEDLYMGQLLSHYLDTGHDVLVVQRLSTRDITEFRRGLLAGMADWTFCVRSIEHAHGLWWDCETVCDRYGVYANKFVWYSHSGDFFQDPVRRLRHGIDGRRIHG